MEITAKQVNQLRQITGAGMMDCKNALMEVEGDIEKSIEILRKKGQKISASRSTKEIKEGSIFVTSSEDHREVLLLALKCETDFVAKNKDFQDLGNAIATAALSRKVESKETLMAIELDGLTVEDKISELMGKIGERIEVANLIFLQDDFVACYVHAGNKLGVLVSMKGADGIHEATEVGKNIGMQIAAMNPLAIDQSSLDQSLIDKELEIIREQIVAEGKPENMIEKISQGKLKKFYKENTLMHQPFVKDTNKTVTQYLEGIAKELTIEKFYRITIEA